MAGIGQAMGGEMHHAVGPLGELGELVPRGVQAEVEAQAAGGNKGRQEGYLRLKHLINLPISAELVVVSACQSGLGGQIRGEGMVGLTRGFLQSGAQQVITSLWDVDDGSTATLMRSFYGGLLGQGLSPAAALRQAQRSMLEHGPSTPYHWAAFVLHGDWR